MVVGWYERVDMGKKYESFENIVIRKVKTVFKKEEDGVRLIDARVEVS
jgi:hypothetical protein